MRRTRPVSTRPGPTSSTRVTPRPGQALAPSPRSAPARSPAASSSSGTRRALRVGCRLHVRHHRWTRALRKAHARRAPGPASLRPVLISSQWKGAETGERHRARVAPRSRRAREAGPLDGVGSPGDHGLGSTRCSWRGPPPSPVSSAAIRQASLHLLGRGSRSRRPWHRGPRGTASCMKRPRACTSAHRASSKEIGSARHQRRELPQAVARHETGGLDADPLLERPQQSARLVVRIAGCWTSVRNSSCSGPSKQSRERERSRAPASAVLEHLVEPPADASKSVPPHADLLAALPGK